MATETEPKGMSDVKQLAVHDIGTAIQLAEDVEETKYSPWTWSMLRLYLVLSCAYLCGCLNGYDGSLMGGLNGMDSYHKYFHMYVNLPRTLNTLYLISLLIELKDCRWF